MEINASLPDTMSHAACAAVILPLGEFGRSENVHVHTCMRISRHMPAAAALAVQASRTRRHPPAWAMS